MPRTSSGIMRPDSYPVEVGYMDEEMNPEDSRYTQHKSYGDRARTPEQLEADQIRKPRLHEGLAFREKI